MNNKDDVREKNALYGELNEIYGKYLENINKFTFIKIITSFYLSDFPNNFSKEIRDPINYLLKFFQGLVKRQVQVKAINNTTFELEIVNENEPVLHEKIPTFDFTLSILNFFESEVKNGKTIINIKETISDELLEIFNSQIIVMLHAYFDSFVSEYYYIVFKMKREKWLNKNVPFTFDEFELGLTEDDFIMKHIKQNLQRESTYDQVKSLLNSVNSNITEILDKKEIELLKECEQVRHIIVHNSGCVDAKFKQKIETQLEEGEKFPLTQEYTDRVFNLITKLLGKLFLTISSNLFNHKWLDVDEMIEQIRNN